jgi:hypothetical protein
MSSDTMENRHEKSVVRGLRIDFLCLFIGLPKSNNE